MANDEFRNEIEQLKRVRKQQEESTQNGLRQAAELFLPMRAFLERLGNALGEVHASISISGPLEQGRHEAEATVHDTDTGRSTTFHLNITEHGIDFRGKTYPANEFHRLETEVQGQVFHFLKSISQ